MSIETRCIKRERWPCLRSIASLWAIWFLEYCCWRCSSRVAAFEAPLCRPTSCFIVGGHRCHTSPVTAGGKLKLEYHWWKKYGGKRVTMLASAKAKHVTPGRPSQRKSVGKKARRILEPASPEEVAEEERRSIISKMNWGRHGRGAKGRRGERGATTTGLKNPWEHAQETAAPREGNMLKCKHFNVCPGCEFDRRFDETPIMVDSSSFMNNLRATGARTRGESNEDNLGYERHVIHPWDPHGWRTVAKLAAKQVSRWGGVELGLYELGSHDVVGIPECRVHHPSVNLAIDTLQIAAKKVGITGFRQQNYDGDLRYVQVAVERSSGKVQLTLVWNEESYADATPKLQFLTKDLRSRKPDLFHSIWVNFRVGSGNAIFSKDRHSWHRCFGPEYLKEIVGPSKIPFFFSPPLFRQANLDHFERIVEAVVEWVPEGSGVCELYAGVGVLGLNCALKARFVRCSDVNSFNPRSFERSRRCLPPDLQRKVTYEALSADEALEDGEADGCEVLIVDPPRKGLDQGVIAALQDPENMDTAMLRRIVYVSCGFDALKRDALSLVGADWTMRHSEGFVLFPGSDHIETLAVFDR